MASKSGLLPAVAVAVAVLMPMPTGAKAMAVMRPSGVLEVGQLRNTLMVGRWTGLGKSISGVEAIEGRNFPHLRLKMYRKTK